VEREGIMRNQSSICLVSYCLGSALLFSITGAHAQGRISLKSGESTTLGLVYALSGCASIMLGDPVVEVLEGPEEVTLEIKKGNVIPRAQNCSRPVPGGTLIATAKDVTERKDAKLTYRVKYKTKEGDRQGGGTYNVSLFP
jgi:hypothetical protein